MLFRVLCTCVSMHCILQDNVIPPEAEAIVNHRIHPAQSVQEVRVFCASELLQFFFVLFWRHLLVLYMIPVVFEGLWKFGETELPFSRP